MNEPMELEEVSERCSKCGGTGSLLHQDYWTGNSSAPPPPITTPCGSCDGTGWYVIQRITRRALQRMDLPASPSHDREGQP